MGGDKVSEDDKAVDAEAAKQAKYASVEFQAANPIKGGACDEGGAHEAPAHIIGRIKGVATYQCSKCNRIVSGQ